MKPRIKNYITYKVIVNKEMKKAVLRFLSGEISSRELGKILDISHQQALNFVNSTCRQWFQEGHLCYYEATNEKVLTPQKEIKNI